MKNIYVKLGVLSSCAILLVASGGAAGGGGGSYELFSSSANKTSILVGSAQQANNKTGGLALVAISGTVKHDTGATTVKDPTHTMTDADGPDSKKILSDANGTLTYSSNFVGPYIYAAGYKQSYKEADVSYDVNGIIGIATQTGDMPTSGTTTFNGEAEVLLVTATSGFDLKSGKSKIEANFGTGKLTATLNGFTSIDQTTGLPGAAPIDEVKISDMSISGNGYSGGTFATTKAGTAVDVVGANAVKSAQGSFYGQNSAANGPAEVGGHVLMKGDGGIVSGSYLAK